MKRLLILTFILNFSLLYSQAKNNKKTLVTEFDSIIHKRIYRVQYSSIHTIELIEFKSGNYKGHLTNVLTRYERKKSKDFIQKITIPGQLTKQLMNDFKKLNIETLEGCGNVFSFDYDCVGALDGDETYITILTKKINKKLNFEAISPGEKEMKGFPKKQKTAQKILNLINDKMNLRKILHQYMSYLPPGTYGYYGIVMIELR